MNSRWLVVMAALGVLGDGAQAQQASSLGAAAGAGGIGVAIARREDALLWNPALLAIGDGPRTGHSVGLDVRGVPPAGWLQAAAPLGLVFPGVDRVHGGIRRLVPGDGVGGGAARVELAAHDGPVALSLFSEAGSRASVPAGLAEALGGEGVGTGGDSAASYIVSGAVVGAGARIAHLPGFGILHVGAAAKGWLVHRHARGVFAGETAGEEVYREAVVENVPGYGVDLGVAVRPAEGFRFGAAVSNVAAGVFRPRQGPRERTVGVVEDAGDVRVAERWTPRLDESDEGTPEAERAAEVFRSTVFPSEARIGVSYAAGAGALGLAWRGRIGDGGLAGGAPEPSWTVGYGGERLPVRGSFGWGAGARRYSLAWAGGRCDARWVLSITRTVAAGGAVLGVGVSRVGAQAACATAIIHPEP